MAHEIEFDENGNPRMFYAGETPWHGLGTSVQEAVSSKEALQLAGLANWDVKMGALYGPQKQSIPFYRSIYRSIDNKVLGVGSPEYKPVQIEEAVAFMDNLFQDRFLRFETAASLKDGRKYFMLAKLDSDISINGDKHAQYFLLYGGHDGLTSMQYFLTDVRVVCNNTVEAAMSGNKPLARVVHFGDMAKRWEVAKASIEATTETQRKLTEWMQKLAQTMVTQNDVEVVRDLIFGGLDDATPTRRANAIRTFQEMYDSEALNFGQNGYSLLNAVTGFGDHGVSVQKKEDGSERMLSMLSGTGHVFKANGMKTIATVLRVPTPMGVG